ncbi:DEAD/DEAH box helicase family protein [Arthrobacter crystallopoietes]|uniref:Superfamily II DNA or RNA helicase n=1 Tax=Crystallibacter crystallopoietes TaxID=37928 RepID=A0A1H0XLF3_9MICC|nr:DEAD/DEAH box helicase family protein [Arthrobacter crystallopoietes]SDQ03737.1 Superfamily II DNA or RNA helicase [Arthrobacter crystallopoietes]
MLGDLGLQTSYRSGRDALLDDFYVPCLQEAVRYDRAVGYFSSTLYQVVGLAFTDFARRGGRLRLVCSPALTPEDFDAMKQGDEIGRRAQETVREDLERLLSNPAAVPATRLLATLIANDIIEVRIAFADKPSGLFHDKLGIFEDLEGKRVSFRGSANETWRAWGYNHESFDVSCSWRNEQELLRTREHADSFQDIWRGREPGVLIARLDEVTREQLVAIADDDLDHAIDEVRLHQGRKLNQVVGRPLMEHQRLVLEDWEAQGHRGIVNFATGAGKTLTAIEGVKRWTSSGGAAVILVPGRDLHAQWIRELESELGEVQILPAGAGSSKSDWMQLLPIFTASGNSADLRRVVIATNATFASSDFQRRLKSGSHLLLVADEMHRAGSQKVLPALEQSVCGATLGLSATFRRQFDDDGTDRLIDFFGPVLSPVIGLAEALMLGLLVPYDYRMHEVTFDDDEQEEYDHLTKRIGQLIAQGEAPGDPDGPLQMLLIKRSRVLKQARHKVPTAVDILVSEYQPGDRWLVYCDDAAQLHAVIDGCLEAGLPTLAFYSGMPSDRDSVIRSLAEHGGIVVAIRCLDEGIDIPVTDHAMILASSTVEREYIQRRGRVLRRAPGTGKVSAEVHDLMLVDRIGGALTKSEALRALEFVRLARNSAARERLKVIVSLSQDPIELPDLLDEEEGSD